MINELNMPKAYTEVLQILKYIPKDEYSKVPNNIIELMQTKSDKNYIYNVEHFSDFENQEMLKETEVILAVLFRDYWATENQRKKIELYEKHERGVIENEKREKYNPDDLFKNRKQYNNIETQIQNNALVEYKESFFVKIKKFFSNLFKAK